MLTGEEFEDIHDAVLATESRKREERAFHSHRTENGANFKPFFMQSRICSEVKKFFCPSFSTVILR
jgi:ubiquitin